MDEFKIGLTTCIKMIEARKGSIPEKTLNSQIDKWFKDPNKD